MRENTRTELRGDLLSMKHRIITKKVANRISEQFHMDEFFEHQMMYWQGLSQVERSVYLKQLKEDGHDVKNMTYSEFYKQLAKDKQLKHFSTFNVEMMSQLLDEYQPKIILDPCMGWGHRMLIAASRQIPYMGFDIKESVVETNQLMLNYAESVFGVCPSAASACDGIEGISKIKHGEGSMLFTCPPYHDSEIYSEDGIENLSYQGFLDWWSDLAKTAFDSGVETFAYQITPDYGDDMLECMTANGYTLDKEILNTRKPKSESDTHYNAAGEFAKRRYGRIYVFKKNENERGN